MGRVSECRDTGCSRLGLALCYLACFVSSTLRREDRYRILAFDAEPTDLLGGWQVGGAGRGGESSGWIMMGPRMMQGAERGPMVLRRDGPFLLPPPSTLHLSLLPPLQERGAGFDRLAAMDRWGAAIRCVRTGGSNVYTAVLQAHALLAEQAKRTPWEGPAHTLVALTDGEAGDEQKFDAASAALRSPDCPGGGFRALLVRAPRVLAITARWEPRLAGSAADVACSYTPPLPHHPRPPPACAAQDRRLAARLRLRCGAAAAGPGAGRLPRLWLQAPLPWGPPRARGLPGGPAARRRQPHLPRGAARVGGDGLRVPRPQRRDALRLAPAVGGRRLRGP